METAYLTCIYRAGRFVVAQYGGHDGMSEFADREIMNFLTPPNIQLLRSKLHLVHDPEMKPQPDEWLYPDDDIGVAILDEIAFASR